MMGLEPTTPCLQSQFDERPGHGHRDLVRGCPLGTGRDCCEWHGSGTADDDVRAAWQRGHLLDRRVMPVETTAWKAVLGPSESVWTGASARTILRCMTTPAQRCPTCGGLLAADKHSLLPPDERLTPWMIHDLPRIAWIVEYRAAELTEEERQIVHDATTRMLHALEPDTV